MLLMYKLVCQGTRRLSEDNMAIREIGSGSYRKCAVRNFIICAFLRIGSSNTGRSDGAADVACIGGM